MTDRPRTPDVPARRLEQRADFSRVPAQAELDCATAGVASDQAVDHFA
jgi:hypothetical protein